MTQIFSNNADTTLAADLLIGGTSIEVADPSKFTEPDGANEYQLITLTSGGLYEVCQMTIRVDQYMNIVRAQEGTVARAWSTGTRVFAGVTAGTMDSVTPADGFERVDSLKPGATALGANAINLQKTRAVPENVASGVGAMALGNVTTASGESSTAMGYDATAQGANSSAIGRTAYAGGAASIALQYGATESANTLSVGALPAAVNTDWDWGNADAFIGNGTMEAVVLSAPVALTATGTITCPVPAGSTFYVNEVGLIVQSADTVTVQPEISFGVTGDNAKLLAAVTTTGLDAVKKRQRFATPLSAHGETSYTFTVTTVATATALTARAYWKGFAVQDETA